MNDTQTLLTKISALRQRLEQAQNLAVEAGSAAAGLFGDGASAPVGRLRALEEKVAAGLEHNALLENSLHDLEGGRQPTDTEGLPQHLTSRAVACSRRPRVAGQMRELVTSRMRFPSMILRRYHGTPPRCSTPPCASCNPFRTRLVASSACAMG
jgi:hypothetical protein